MTIAQRINARIEKRDADEKGLALLDVLLGMAIFALIVVIGVQNFSTLRNRAYTTQVSSDAKQTATAIQAYMTQPGITAAPTTVDAAFLTANGVNLTSGNRIGATNGYAPSGDNFTVCIERGATGPSARYNSATSVVTTAAGACA